MENRTLLKDVNWGVKSLGRNILTLMLAVMAFAATAQAKSVTGTVTDEAGEAVIGANVAVQGTKMGTVTDIDGNFALNNVADNAVLVISYVGYVTEEVSVAGKSVINVTIRENREVLDEVVVIGYGTVKRKDLTGAVSSMKNSDVVVAPTNNVMEALSGKVAGMDITKGSGEVGSDVSILLRGSRSIYGSNEPLFHHRRSSRQLQSGQSERYRVNRHPQGRLLYGYLWFGRSQRCDHYHYQARRGRQGCGQLRCLLRIQWRCKLQARYAW